PVYSAKKIGGERSHRLARAGQARGIAPALATPVLPAPVPVTAHAIEIVGCEDDRVTLVVTCSAGFYVRSLAHDLGERLGTGAHLAELRRTRSGDAILGEAVPLGLVEGDRPRAREAVRPMAGMLPALSAVVLTTEGIRRAGHGRDLGPADFEK